MLWFIVFCFLLIASLIASFILFYKIGAIYLSSIIFSGLNFNFCFSIYVDWIAIIFLSVVTLIALNISIYSFFYMSPYSNPNYFLWLIFFFVVSMFIVILFSDLFFLMLGWDGLGLVSFLLIMYYQNSSSIYSSLVTLIINRIGDCFFLISIILLTYSNFSLNCVASSGLSDFLTVSFLVITFITNSAIFPFSPWLPLAMSAPTPISALVHSSTLVTSGLFLIMRYSYLIYSFTELCNVLVLVCIFTSFYAGLTVIFEVDMNNVIALSTLSHLGFIGSSFFIGMLEMSFFHLLSHALFKSLLFIAIGDVIVNLDHSQDIRYLSSGALYAPFSSFLISVSFVSLFGLISTVGYFSNDLILEFYLYSNLSLFGFFILVVNVGLTFYYTLKLLYFFFSPNKLIAYHLFSAPINIHAVLLTLSSFSTLLFGFFFLQFCFPFHSYALVPLSINLYPLLLIFIGFFMLFVFNSPLTVMSKVVSSYGGSIMFLSYLCTTVSSAGFTNSLFLLLNPVESGVFFVITNKLTQTLILNSASFLFKHLTVQVFFSLISVLLFGLFSFIL